MSVASSSNKLFNSFLIIITYENNSFFVGNLIDHRIFLFLEKFKKHENYNHIYMIKQKRN